MKSARRLLERLEVAIEREDELAAARAIEALRRDYAGSWEASYAEVIDADDDDLLAALERHVAHFPDDADGRHQLGSALLDAGRDADAVAQWLEVLALDESSDRSARVGRPAELARVMATAERTLKRLPSPFCELLENVPVMLEDRPSAELVSEVFDPRAYGLFEGPTLAETRLVDAPPQISRIVLFTHNLCADFPDLDVLKEQVEITVLHEVGHYLGLDEEGVARLGLA